MIAVEIAFSASLWNAICQMASFIAWMGQAMPISMQVEPVGAAALPSWSITFKQGDSIYMTVVLRFIQLVGFVGILKGSVGTMRYVSPEPHPKKPPSLFAPLAQIFFGMLALVPEVVIAMASDLVDRVNW